MKTDKTGGDRFWRFTENRSVKFKFFKILGNCEIKFSKKLESISRFLVKTELKILKQRVLQNSSKCKMM
jgi:hypothetical protein